MNSRRSTAAQYALAVILVALSTGLAARAQALSVIPVNIYLAPGERASSLTVTNQGTTQTSIQIRAFTWNQYQDQELLAPSDLLVVSPPIATLAPGASQVIRLVLRERAQVRENTYRILLDQIPPPAEPGVVHVALRLSIPVFAQPGTRVNPDVQFFLDTKDGQLFLVGINNGLRHLAIREIELSTSDGHTLKTEGGSSPYILAGATRHWKIDAQTPFPPPSEKLQLKAQSDAGAIERQVSVVAAK
jgi:fimbrial chaperone protein